MENLLQPKLLLPPNYCIKTGHKQEVISHEHCLPLLRRHPPGAGEDIHSGQDNLWNFLFFTGYLKKISERLEEDTIKMTLALPNTEVRSIYSRHIMTWLGQRLEGNQGFGRLFAATLSGDTETMQEEISKALFSTISYYDSSESFYHGFMAGVYRNMPDYIPESNAEYGKGRPDLVLRWPSIKGKAIIIEFKATKDPQAMDACCRQALAQIREKDYVRGVQAKGYKDILCYGISFYGKDCIVKKVASPS